MGYLGSERTKFTEADLDFVIHEVAPDSKNKARLKYLAQDDDDFRKALLGDERVFRKLVSNDYMFLNVSPNLYFEVLLRRALNEIESATYTLEWDGKQNIPVFDTVDVMDVFASSEILNYLAEMLASFTRIHTHIVSVRVRQGIRRRIRYSDMDIDSLVSLSSNVDDRERFGFYKRIADVCLFIAGIFPPTNSSNYYNNQLGEGHAKRRRQSTRTVEDYEQEGRRFYSLIGDHPTAQTLNLSEVFGLLSNNFATVCKPLSFISTHYLHSRKNHLFSAPV